jgi:hypothetical protein
MGTLAAQPNRSFGHRLEIERNCYVGLRKSAWPGTLRQQQAAGAHRQILQSSL